MTERAEVGEAREAVFAVTIPEQRGSFKRFCSLVGARNVTEFSYRISDARQAHVFVGVQVGLVGPLREYDANADYLKTNAYALLPADVDADEPMDVDPNYLALMKSVIWYSKTSVDYG